MSSFTLYLSGDDLVTFDYGYSSSIKSSLLPSLFLFLNDSSSCSFEEKAEMAYSKRVFLSGIFGDSLNDL
jgi:hypothetical protein